MELEPTFWKKEKTIRFAGKSLNSYGIAKKLDAKGPLGSKNIVKKTIRKTMLRNKILLYSQSSQSLRIIYGYFITS